MAKVILNKKQERHTHLFFIKKGVVQPFHGLKMPGVKEVISYHVKDSFHCAIGIEVISID